MPPSTSTLWNATRYVLNHARDLLTDDSAAIYHEAISVDMLDDLAGLACKVWLTDEPRQWAQVQAMVRRYLTQACGYEPLDALDPLIERAAGDFDRADRQLQAQLLKYALLRCRNAERSA